LINSLVHSLACAAFVLTLITSPALAQVTRYVAPGGTGDGSDWDNAYGSVQDAVDDCSTAGDIIYVKAGTITHAGPDGGSAITIADHPGLTIEGGYAGNTVGGLPGEKTNETSIVTRTGQCRVFHISSSTVTMHTVTIQDGLLDTADAADKQGGGMRAVDSVLSVTNCVFKGNAVAGVDASIANLTNIGGGGIYASGTTLSVVDSLFTDNRVQAWDGHAWSDSICYGGAIYSDGGQLTARNCRFLSNRAVVRKWDAGIARAGAVYVTGGSGHSIRNCLFAGNSARDSGDALRLNVSVAVNNCTFADHVKSDTVYATSGTIAFTNCIFWGNAGSDVADDGAGVTLTLDNCCIEDGVGSYGGSGNVTTDPLFVRGFYLSQIAAGQSADSSCLNTGTGTAFGTTRTDGTADASTVDMGYHYAAGVTTEDIYVTAGGNDGTGTGAIGAPYRTLTKALTEATEYVSVIHVGTGTYDTVVGEVFPLAMKSGVQIIGSGSSAAGSVVTAGTSGKRVMDVTECVRGTEISGLRLTSGRAEALLSDVWYDAIAPVRGGGGIFVDLSALSVSDCVLSGNTVNYGNDSYEHSYGGGIFAYLSTLTVVDSRFENNTAKAGSGHTSYNRQADGGGLAVYGGIVTVRSCEIVENLAIQTSSQGYTHGGGVYVNRGNEHLIRNCVIASNKCDYATADLVETGHGIFVNNSAGVTIENCTIADNYGALTDQGVDASASTVNIKNSILWNNGMDATGTVTLAYCDIEVAGADVTTNDCISTDPFFADAAGDYHLKSMGGRWDPTLNAGAGDWVVDDVMSPCIDAGDPNDPLPGDLVEPQLNGGRVNQGAYGNTLYASKGPPPPGTVFFVR
jgi:hypothetical protein